MAAVAAAAIAATGTARVTADEEWWDHTPYYEEDSWLDITEWFDGNDYNPTDETAFRWDNETYEASNDTGTDDNGVYDEWLQASTQRALINLEGWHCPLRRPARRAGLHPVVISTASYYLQ